MATVIKSEAFFMSGDVSSAPSSAVGLGKTLRDVLPIGLYMEIESLERSGRHVEEIRIRTERRCYATLSDGNAQLSAVCTRSEVDAMVMRICENSLYAHAHTITQGFLTLDGGIRVGIVGRAATENGRIVGVYDVSAMCFRLPRRIEGVGSVVSKLVREKRGEGGVLVYSPPGEGKTTLLRSVIATLASFPAGLRVAVIDTRGELSCYLSGERLSVDVLSGYPRPIGIEIAARTMNAQLIVCDEIGGIDEAEAIISAQNCGAPLLATAHAATLSGLLRRTGFLRLHESEVFAAYVGIRRRREGYALDYEYTVTERNTYGAS